MAVFYIAEYGAMKIVEGFGVSQIPDEDTLITEQTVAIGAEAKSAAFNAGTTFIRVHTDAVCSFLYGANPTATTAKKRLAAGQTEYFGVTAGKKISVITNT